jgi:predicted nucleic acid-binding protein
VTLQPEERLVIDARVAVKWVVPEPDSTRAEVLLDHGLVAPDLLFVECANVLWEKVRRGPRTDFVRRLLPWSRSACRPCG